MERHAFLGALTWLCPFDAYLDEAAAAAAGVEAGEGGGCVRHWPPRLQAPPPPQQPGASPAAAAARRQGQGQATWPLTSRVILQDCTCCLHRGRDLLFFAPPAAETGGGGDGDGNDTGSGSGSGEDDPTQLSFAMALGEVRPGAFRRALRAHQRLLRRHRRRSGSSSSNLLLQAAAVAQAAAGEPMASASSSSTTQGPEQLLQEPEQQEDEEEAAGAKEEEEEAAGAKEEEDEEEEDEDEDEEECEEEHAGAGGMVAVPALFFRVGGRVYLVDHTAVETIVCPRVDHNHQQPAQPPQVPPFASFKFPTVTLRFWLSRLSLSPLNATQPLVSAIDAVSRGLTPRVWLPPPLALTPGTGTGAGTATERSRSEEEGEDAEEEEDPRHVETFLRAVDTLLAPPVPGGWPAADAACFLRLAGRAFGKAVAPLSSRGPRRVRARREAEQRLKGELDEALHRLFPQRRAGSAAAAAAAAAAATTHTSADGPGADELDGLVRAAEAAAASLKALARARHRASLAVQTVRAPQGEDVEKGEGEMGTSSDGTEGGEGGGGGGGERRSPARPPPAKRARAGGAER